MQPSLVAPGTKTTLPTESLAATSQQLQLDLAGAHTSPVSPPRQTSQRLLARISRHTRAVILCLSPSSTRTAQGLPTPPIWAAQGPTRRTRSQWITAGMCISQDRLNPPISRSQQAQSKALLYRRTPASSLS